MAIILVKGQRERPVTYRSLLGCNGSAMASHVLSIGARKILIDPGSIGGRVLSGRLSELKGLRYVLLTHAHFDHVGGLIQWMESFPNVQVYATATTKQACRQVLKWFSVFKESCIDDFVKRIKVAEYGREIELERGLRVTFFPAGHTFGSASILISSTPEGNFLFTGDYSDERRGVLKPFTPPERELRTMVSEGTAASTPKVSSRTEMQGIARQIIGSISRGGRVVVATNPLSALFEIAIMMQHWQHTGHCQQFPIYVNGGLSPLLEAFLSSAAGFDLPPEQFAAVSKVMLSHNAPVYEQITQSSEPFCCFAGPASGRAEFPRQFVRQTVLDGGTLIADGAIRDRTRLVRALTSRPRNSIPEAGVQMRSLVIHADRGGLIKSVRKCRPKQTVLTHGRPTELIDLANQLPGKVCIPNEGEEVWL